MQSLTWMVRGGLAMAATGLVWMVWPSQQADRWYTPRIETPTFVARPWPRVLFDEAHLNFHTPGDRYRAFAQLLRRDGFRVLPNQARLSVQTLAAGDVFVTVNALGYKGLAQHLANLAHLDRVVQLDADAFAADEIQALASWVEAGGRALIIADHAPAGLASRGLARAFGVEMTNWWAEDRGNAEVTFTRVNGGLLDHPISNGRNPAERIESVTTFTGQALKPPPGADVLLRFSDAAREYPTRASREDEGRSAAGLAQAVALRVGRGRVVVLGEAAALTAQRILAAGKPDLLIGMNRRGTGNQQFALNVMHWLMGLLP